MNLSQLDLNLLKALDALLTDLNVTKAARRMDVSQPAMSNSLARLRHMLGDPLLVRGPGGMLPTPRAQELHDPIRRILSDVQRVIGPLGSFDPPTSEETFVIAATDYVELLLLPGVIRRLRAAAPGIKVVLRSVEGSKLPDDLTSGRIDVAIAFFQTLSPKLRKQVLFSDEFICVVSRHNPMAKNRLSLQTFLSATHLQISPSGRLGGRLDDALQGVGMRRNVNFVTSHFIAGAKIASQTDVITVIAKRIGQYLSDILPVKLLALPVETKSLNLILAWHERTHRDPARSWLRKQIQDSAREIEQQ